MDIDEFNANRHLLEPIASAAQTDEEVYGLSLAVSAKRQADALERIAAVVERAAGPDGEINIYARTAEA